MNQQLTFDYTTNIFRKHGVDFGEDKYVALGMKNHELNLFTNLGLLLSEQCTHTIKAAVFSDEQNTIFKDRKEFSGSIFKQLEEAYDYLQLCNHNRAVINGLEREDYWDYPEAAVREALLNALIHRDYNYSGSIIINVNDKEMEFISIGGLLSGITQEDIKNGISLSRNSKLAGVFHRLKFIESYGTGIRRIFSLYKNCEAQPVITVTPNSFKMTLPNINAYGNKPKESGEQVQIELTPQMETILGYLSDYGEITPKDVESLLDVKRTRAYVITKQLIDAGLIKAVGRGENKKYTAV